MTASLTMGKPFRELFQRENRNMNSETVTDKCSLRHGGRAGGYASQVASPRKTVKWRDQMPMTGTPGPQRWVAPVLSSLTGRRTGL